MKILEITSTEIKSDLIKKGNKLLTFLAKAFRTFFHYQC